MGILKANVKEIQKFIDNAHINRKLLMKAEPRTEYSNLPNKVDEIEA